MARALLGGRFIMNTSGTRIAFALGLSVAAGTSLVACTSPDPDPDLGQASLSQNGGSSFAAAAWVERSYAWFGSSDEAYIVYSVYFTADPAASTAKCSTRTRLQQLEDIDLDSTDVIHRGGTPPQLQTGTYQVGQEPDGAGPPPVTTAVFMIDKALTSGNVTIATSDGSGITGSFTASGGTPAATLTGSFDAPICDLGPGN